MQGMCICMSQCDHFVDPVNGAALYMYGWLPLGSWLTSHKLQSCHKYIPILIIHMRILQPKKL
jgi:hypothetical protein